MGILIFILIIILILFSTRSGGGKSEFDNIYKNIPTKFVKSLPANTFKGLYICTEDQNLPIWKIKDGQWSFVWNSGYDFLPFARFHVERSYLENLFYKLQTIVIPFEIMPYKLERLPHRLTLFEKYELFRIEGSYAELVDYFQEEVRMLCKRRGRKSHWDMYRKMHYPSIQPLNYNIVKYKQIQDDLWKNSYSCTEIDPQVTIGILQWASGLGFAVTNMLDISAGRGSRMTAAIACPFVQTYTGIDPNSLSHEWYTTQAEYYCHLYNSGPLFAGFKNPKNFKVIHDGFVEAELPYDYYDIMFSSPPYFDLEVYSEDDKQSVLKNSSFDGWLKGFMLRSMEKIIDHLRPGGLMCININISRVYKDDWVSPLLDFKKNCKYLGCLSYYKKESDSVQPIWIWKKKDLIVDRKIEESILQRFNVRSYRGRIEDIPKYTKKIKNTVTMLEVEGKFDKGPIWKYVNDRTTIFINNTGQILPFVMFEEPLPVFRRTGCEWSIINRKAYNPLNIDQKYYNMPGSPNSILLVKSGHLNDLSYFTDKLFMVCSRKNNITPWQIYFKMKSRMRARQFHDWCYFNRILCLTSSDSVYIAPLQFLRQLGHKMSRILVPEQNFNMTATSAIMFIGCDYCNFNVESDTLRDVNYTVLNTMAHGIKKWTINAPEPPFDFIYYNPTFYDAADFANERDLSNKFKRLDLWRDHLAEEINRLSTLLDPAGGIILFHTEINQFGGNDFFKKINLILVGGFIAYRNSMISFIVFSNKV
jgi:hypothetical protein